MKKKLNTGLNTGLKKHGAKMPKKSAIFGKRPFMFAPKAAPVETLILALEVLSCKHTQFFIAPLHFSMYSLIA